MPRNLKPIFTLLPWFLASWVPGSSFAADWGQLATISSTMGVQGSKVCLGEATRGDIGCPAYAPSVTPQGYLGIGTTTPSTLLQIGNNIYFDEGKGATANGPDIRFSSGGIIATEIELHLNIDSTANGKGSLIVGKGTADSAATTLLTLTNNGDLQLGYDDMISDTRLLTVRSNGYAGIAVRGDSANISDEPGGAYVAFYLDSNMTAPNAYYIGKTNRTNENPMGVSVTDVLANSLLLGSSPAGSSSVQLAVADAVYMTVLGTNGNIGIGTTAPAVPLHVSGTLRVQNGSVVTCNIGTGTGTTACTSDARLKTDILPVRDALAKLGALRGVTFRWKAKDAPQGEHLGVIAQEVEQVFPQAVDTLENGTKTVDYGVLVAPLIEAVKELKADNVRLRRDVDALLQQ